MVKQSLSYTNTIAMSIKLAGVGLPSSVLSKDFTRENQPKKETSCLVRASRRLLHSVQICAFLPVFPSGQSLRSIDLQISASRGDNVLVSRCVPGTWVAIIYTMLNFGKMIHRIFRRCRLSFVFSVRLPFPDDATDESDRVYKIMCVSCSILNHACRMSIAYPYVD
jgi:hypothetical protein